MSTPDPGTWLLDRIDARERALTSQIEQIREQIEELTGHLRDLDQDLDHLRITRKTLLVLAAEPIRHRCRHRLPCSPITPPTSTFSPS
ncbi:hypothetical protein MF672_039815 [Actinomadura sp. ATCC 31491]|uniref:Uncharacterized protein n=1 Tax=Actinomadura luzonensis TaxID=2805427 RepID=A0ABT0G722_9ACTN|nr:hypothetical protein [Actinomadura luzonensis]MCK2219901.1 hypothetical protein [Actinomadura luzonensis]